ncbi:Hypothetical protein PMT_2802 [Prochlorococcus marinus str. MIT 9313]|uniref:Uncharacterized protein n=1 Tax=Prochlorococcus marinus (strain MIT 9313) TaxID=74547 RepID=B9ESH5_PROMM|nr:Hypothetical protein PMT_2802 [Prochlorococcus marinus str. MIT 9313]
MKLKESISYSPTSLDYLCPALQTLRLRTAGLARSVQAHQELITLHLYVQSPHMATIAP